MKLLYILPLATIATAIVLPDEQVLAELAIEDHHEQKPQAPGGFLEDIKHGIDDLKEKVDEVIDAGKNYLDEAIAAATNAEQRVSQKFQDTAFDVESWLEDAPYDNLFNFDPPPPPPHDGPHHPPGHKKPGHKKPGHKRPHHPPHHGHHSNLTIYELISKSKYTTKLAKLVEDDEDLVKVLNSTKANFTLFAPTDHAFAKIPEHAPKPSKEIIKKVLLYHISESFYPAGRVLRSHTIPSLYNESALGEDTPQRLAVKIGFKGLTINYYSKIVATNIFAKNGVIHGVDSIILPPPDVLAILGFLPGEFSTLSLGLTKTGLLDELNATAHAGSTVFAPSNFAFKKLGPKINGFLFSKWGEKYLKALLKYHVVHNQTLYSDAFYSSESVDGTSEREYSILEMPRQQKCHARDGAFKTQDAADKDKKAHRRGPPLHFHFDLPTLLEDRNLAVDVGRFGPFITIKINGFTRVAVQDGVAKDGVIQVVGDVLIPPKKLPGKDEVEFWMGEEMTLEEFKERVGPMVEGGAEEGEEEWEDL